MKAIFIGWLLLLLYSGLGITQDMPVVMDLRDHWQVIADDNLHATPEAIAQSDYSANAWYSAQIPSTALNVLVQNGVYPHILDGLALQNVNVSLFETPWWYRTTFQVDPTLPVNAQLFLYGINYSADIWLNGQLIASGKTLYCPFRQFALDITKQLIPGDNVLAIKVSPPTANDWSIGFVDWNPNPPDRSMGIVRPIQIHFNAGIEIKDPFVHTNLNSPQNDEAQLAIELTLINHQENPSDISLDLHIDDALSLSKNITLQAHETKTLVITPDDDKQLIITHPKLWWPNKMGEPNLYTLTATVRQNNHISDRKMVHFGIRKIETWINSYQDAHQKTYYYRGFKINGQPLLIRGAAWTDNLLLNNTPQNIKDQLNYAKAMNLNAIRLEGFWGNDDTLYETCDQLGLLIMIGWSAQWEWPLQGFRKPEQCDNQYGCFTTDEDKALIVEAFKDQLLWLRNHPSIFVWMLGSDLKPQSTLESQLAQVFSDLNIDVPYVISAAEQISAFTGQPSGIKMRGPYVYVPPVYWFENARDGGAFGFNSETGPGAEIPPNESLKQLLGNPADYWPNTTPAWIYHLGAHPKLQTLERIDHAMAMRYGIASSLKDYAQKAQLMNYESVRPMFEAFAAYRAGNPYLHGVPSTGVFHWMLNAAWPKFFWQLYDYYLVPGAAYFSAMEANKPLHVFYNYANQGVYLNNDTQMALPELHITARVFDSHSQLLSKQHWKANISANTAKKIGLSNIPALPSLQPGFNDVYFIELTLEDADHKQLDRTVYWLSSTPDQLGIDTNILQHANYQALNHLPKVPLRIEKNTTDEGAYKKIEITLHNDSDYISFFNHVILKTQNKPILAPIDWSDNFITLCPHQSITVIARIKQSELENEPLLLSVEGINLKEETAVEVARAQVPM